ncbi:hypothetical protein [Opitutus sp. GAS368]|jgi:hypothetical protein|uniref:LolA family protein n=1 Tax=Opitutus sp. GAS368 TaxID=1882749 RepID=UPI0008794BBB|nr:hypothetical protein [Opitutus sp. GAS368]SDR77258.1 hypothetical protein SAMN05444173_0818 [Opitutus sp. GAS368]
MKARLVLAVAALLGAVLPATAQTAEQWIARARARLGSESALQGVTSVHFVGTIEVTEKVPSETDKAVLVDRTVSRAMDVIFQKPMQQRFTFTSPELIEVLALDDYDAWQKRTNPKNPTQWQLTLLDATQTKRLRAQAWDNLNFLRGIEKLRGSVTVGGDATVDGLACVKLVFSYSDNIVLTRYYDKATARLVKTETEAGVEIREEGEMFVNGIRFARKVSNREKSGRIVTLNFEQVVLNETFPASDFAVPPLQAN